MPAPAPQSDPDARGEGFALRCKRDVWGGFAASGTSAEQLSAGRAGARLSQLTDGQQVKSQLSTKMSNLEQLG